MGAEREVPTDSSAGMQSETYELRTTIAADRSPPSNSPSCRPAGFRKIPRGAGEILALPISYFPICNTTKRTFLGWVKEVRTTKS
jgi:hypothetical protein